jgi:diguanylate cyclase (GGDEF)-like protein/PAS domain S-box-containing protein
MSLEKVSTIMSRDVLTLEPTEILRSAIEKMNFNNISCIVVLKNKKAVGILTERDIIRFVGLGLDFQKTDLLSIMRRPVIAVSEQTDISEAAHLMVINGVRRLVVVDDKHKIIGIITQTDIIRNLSIESFISSKKLEHIMVRKIISIKKKDQLHKAIELMGAHNISCMLVMEDKKPLGLISERDITKSIAENSISNSVEDIMTCAVLTAPKDLSLFDATRLMDEKRMRCLVVVSPKGNALGIVTKSDIIRNLRTDYIDLLKRMLEEKSRALIESEVKYRTLVEQSLEGIMIVQDNIIKFINPKLLTVLSYKEQEIVGKDVLRFLYPDDREILSENIKKLYKNKDAGFPLEIRMIHKNEEIIYMEVLSTLIQYEGSPAILITLRDISERKKTEAELKRLVITDDLTGLFNQRYFYIETTKEIERAKRHKRPLSILLIDIDLFKDFNDRYGHWEGDFVLKKVGEIIMKSIRDIDFAFRYGGEEFAVILPETSHKEAIVVAERIRKAVAETVFYPFTLDGQPDVTSRTVSIGVTEFRMEDTIKSFLKRVDNAMYTAKHRGRNTVMHLHM